MVALPGSEFIGARQGVDGGFEVSFAPLGLAEAEVEIAGHGRIGIQGIEDGLEAGDRHIELSSLNGGVAFGETLLQGTGEHLLQGVDGNGLSLTGWRTGQH